LQHSARTNPDARRPDAETQGRAAPLSKPMRQKQGSSDVPTSASSGYPLPARRPRRLYGAVTQRGLDCRREERRYRRYHLWQRELYAYCYIEQPIANGMRDGVWR